MHGVVLMLKIVKSPNPILNETCEECDLADEERIKEIRKTLPKGIPAQLISSVSGKGLQELKDLLWKALNG